MIDLSSKRYVAKEESVRRAAEEWVGGPVKLLERHSFPSGTGNGYAFSSQDFWRFESAEKRWEVFVDAYTAAIRVVSDREAASRYRAAGRRKRRDFEASKYPPPEEEARKTREIAAGYMEAHGRPLWGSEWRVMAVEGSIFAVFVGRDNDATSCVGEGTAYFFGVMPAEGSFMGVHLGLPLAPLPRSLIALTHVDAERVAEKSDFGRGIVWRRTVQRRNSGLYLEADQVGAQRWLYWVVVQVCRDTKYPTPEEWDRQKEGGVVDEKDVRVDAATGELCPHIDMWATAAEPASFLLDQPVCVTIDGRLAYLYYPPLVHKDEPYMFVDYLNDTLLWHGKVTRKGEDEVEVIYGTQRLHATPKQTSVHEGDKLLGAFGPPVVDHRRRYLNYKAIAALTADSLTWNAKRHLLKIETPPVRKE